MTIQHIYQNQMNITNKTKSKKYLQVNDFFLVHFNISWMWPLHSESYTLYPTMSLVLTFFVIRKLPVVKIKNELHTVAQIYVHYAQSCNAELQQAINQLQH